MLKIKPKDFRHRTFFFGALKGSIPHTGLTGYKEWKAFGNYEASKSWVFYTKV